MNFEDFQRLAASARADGPPGADVAPAVLARLRLGERRAATAGDGGSRGLIVALVSASAAAASVLAFLGYEALQTLEQAGAGVGLPDPFSLWASL